MPAVSASLSASIVMSRPSTAATNRTPRRLTLKPSSTTSRSTSSSQADARHDPAIDAAAARSDGAGYGVIAGLGFGTLFALVGQIDDDAGFFPLALLQLTVAATVVVIATSLRQPWIPRGRGLAPVFAFGLLGSAALVFSSSPPSKGCSRSSR